MRNPIEAYTGLHFACEVSEVRELELYTAKLEQQTTEYEDEFKRVDSEKNDLLIELKKRDKSFEELEKRLKFAVEALEYYGSGESWGCDDYGRTDVSYNCGSEAREALSKIRGE